MEKELGVYGVVQANGSKIELIKWNPDKDGTGRFEYDWDTILAAYKSAFYDCFGYRRKNKYRRKDKGGVSGDGQSGTFPKSVFKEYSSWHTADCGTKIEGRIVFDENEANEEKRNGQDVSDEWKGYNKEYPFYDE